MEKLLALHITVWCTEFIFAWWLWRLATLTVSVEL